MAEKDKIDRLKVYYKYLFPHEKIRLWLSYGIKSNFMLREFSFVTVGDIFSRYESFEDGESFLQKLLTLAPNRIDVGPIWNQRPLWSARDKLVPVRKELVIDIDLTDYDDVRICCEKKKICTKCWKYMVVACKIIHSSLTEDWGFKNILWVFSGRRGIHAWVCDENVLEFRTAQRASISRFFQLISGNSFGKTHIKLTRMNDYIERAVKIIDEFFVPLCVVEQDMLGTEKRIERFIDLLPYKSMKKEVRELFEKFDSSKDRWDAFLDYFHPKIASGAIAKDDKYFIEEIKLLYCYPRIDNNVTIVVNHLLKLPFSIHPKTNRVSVPFDPESVDSFDPVMVPSLRKIVNEYEIFKESVKSDSNLNSLIEKSRKTLFGHKTSLKNSLRVFDNFLVNLYSSRHPERLLAVNKNCDGVKEEDIFAD